MMEASWLVIRIQGDCSLFTCTTQYSILQYTEQHRYNLAILQYLYLVCQHVAAGVVAVVGDHQPGGQLAGLRVVQGLHQLDRSVQFGTQRM